MSTHGSAHIGFSPWHTVILRELSSHAVMVCDLTQVIRMPPVTPSKQKNAMSLPLRSQTVMDKTRPGTQENNASRKSRSASEPSVFINGR